jgi:ribosome assembly protein RRB1
MKRKGEAILKQQVEKGIEFDDPFEDEFDDQSELEHNSNKEEEEEEEDEEEEEEEDCQEEELKVYVPGLPLLPDEILAVDPSAYDMLHSLNVEWPCLSFDILYPSNTSPAYPLSCYFAAGSQAADDKLNKIYVMKTSNMYKTREIDSDDEDSDDGIDEDPIVEYRVIPHHGAVNRLRYDISLF